MPTARLVGLLPLCHNYTSFLQGKWQLCPKILSGVVWFVRITCLSSAPTWALNWQHQPWRISRFNQESQDLPTLLRSQTEGVGLWFMGLVLVYWKQFCQVFKCRFLSMGLELTLKSLVYMYLFLTLVKKNIQNASFFGHCLGIQSIIRINFVNMTQGLDLIISLIRLSVPWNKF